MSQKQLWRPSPPPASSARSPTAPRHLPSRRNPNSSSRQKDILESKSIQQGGRTITIREIKPIDLPQPPAPVEVAPTAADAAFIEQLKAYNAAHPRPELLCLGATVFNSAKHPPRTLVRYWSISHKSQITFWSSADFSLIAGGISSFTDTTGAAHSIFMSWSHMDAERADKFLAVTGRLYQNPEVPTFPEGKATFQIIGAQPDAEELIAIQSLHDIYIIDTNTNGVSDTFERQYNNGNLFPTFDPQADPDGDGWTNEHEAAAGTDPLNANPPNGFIRPETQHIPAFYGDENGQPVLLTPESFTLTWPVTTGKQYTLQFSLDLSAGSWSPVGEPFIAGNAATYGFPTADAEKCFWRVAVTDVDTDNDGLTDSEEHQIGSSPYPPANPQFEGDLVLKIKLGNNGQEIEAMKMKLTVVKQLGAKKYFHTSKDYILERNTRFHIKDAEYEDDRFGWGDSHFRVVSMRESATTLFPIDASRRAGGAQLKGIDSTAAAFPGISVAINGALQQNLWVNFGSGRSPSV